MDIEAFSNESGYTGRARFLANGSPADWTAVFSATREVAFQPGEVLVRAGEVRRSMYIVLAGRLAIEIPTEGHALRKVGDVEPGSIFGEQSFVDGLPRSGQVTALAGGTARVLDYEAFLTLARRRPELAQRIMFDIAAILSLRLRETNRLLV